MNTLRIILAVSLLAAPALRAQIVADGTTNTLSNVTNTLTGDVTVGTNGSFTLLILSDNSLLTNSVNGIIGRNVTAKSNEVQLLSPSARWRMGGSLFVGSNGAMSRLVISNGAFVDNYIGTLGQTAASSNNTVLVTGSGSVWSNAFILFVGNLAPGNQLQIKDGGLVYSEYATVGSLGAGTNNEVIVTDPGSLWANRLVLEVGGQRSFNRLIVSNGAAVKSDIGVVGSTGASRNNEVVVTGAGSVWSNQTALYVGGESSRMEVSDGGWLAGNHGSLSGVSNTAVLRGNSSGWNNLAGFFVGENASGNVLIASNGATVLSSNATIGAITSGARDNLAMLSGAGTLWSNRNDFIVGEFSIGNRLIVSNSATVLSSNLFVGFNSSATNNRVTVDGGTLRVTSAAGTGVLDVRRGTNVLNAGLIDADQLRMTNPQGFFEFNGGLLITRGALISNGVPFVVGTFGPNPAVWDVRAGASNHVLTVPLSLGQFSSFNQLLVANGALLSSVGGFIGLHSNARSNTAVVAGPGSTWSNSATLEIGSGGPGSGGSYHSLVVSNGGFVRNTSGTLGSFGGNNLALVTGASSVWSNADLTIGLASASNHLVISDGGTVKNDWAFVSFGLDSSNNLATVTGPNAVWQTVNQLNFGYVGAGNQLVVSNGGKVLNNSFVLGSSTSRSNVALVTGSGSVLSNASLMYIGEGSAGNRLVVANGGELRAGDGTFVGNQNTSSNNVALVTDSGSALNGDVTVGTGGARNQLVVTNGAVALGNFGSVGAFGNSNLALVTGSGSVWSNAVELSVGIFGSGNQLVVSNGAVAASGVGFLGRNTNANLNLAIVTDPGTRWLLSSNLHVGNNGAFNRLVLTNGARLENAEGIIGNGISSSNNEVWITGAGSIWTNRQSLYVGESGSRNRLVVNDGGFVRSIIGFIGHNASSSSNEVVITGAGSLWNIPNSLLVGSAGSGNRVVVTNGGWLRTDGAAIGSSSTNNQVLVTGAGSSWTNLADLRVGQSGSGNLLVVTNGGEVFEVQGVIVGRDASSINNRVIVDGGTLRAQNLGGSAFDVRRGTTILNAGLIEVGQLLLTNSGGFLQFNGGTLSAANSRVSHGTLFDIGNNTSPATFILAGNGLHVFTGILTARVFSNATFTGNGTIGGVVPLQFRPGSRLVPGSSVGKMIFSNSPSLQGTVIMEISRNGATLTNDQIQVIGTLTYGGSLMVSNIGPDSLVAGNRFPLFDATNYAGSFSSIVLPALDSSLYWTNNLGVDGSIEVVSTLPAAPTLSFQLNNNLLLLSWPSNASDFSLETTFDLTPPAFWQPVMIGSPTNSALFVINPAIPQQYFRLAFPGSPAASGFASAAGGTTGGSGGPIVTASTMADFESYATNPAPHIILVLGTLTAGVDEIQVGNNKTIIGVGTGPTIIGELELDGSTNVIFHNLFIENDGVSGTGDGVRIIGGSHHIWVDHCTFTDCSDGSLDITQASDYVTVSWCKFNYTRDNGHNFVNLIGASDGDTGNYRLTFHHNWWSTLCKSRMPSQRFGECHVFNNYFDCAGNNDASNVRLQAQMLSENNFYNAVANPIFKGFTFTGQLIQTAGNTYTNCTGTIDPGTDTVFTPPYAYTLDATAVVPNIVTNSAGAKSSP